MRAYADTSFMVKLVTDEPGSEAAMAEFRRLDFPALFFLPLHGLEVANAIRHRAFHLRRTAGTGQAQLVTTFGAHSSSSRSISSTAKSALQNWR